jgi:hypothetical protein
VGTWTISARARMAAAHRAAGARRAETARLVRPGGRRWRLTTYRPPPKAGIVMRAAAWRTPGSARPQPQETEEPSTTLCRTSAPNGAAARMNALARGRMAAARAAPVCPESDRYRGTNRATGAL